MTPPTGELPPVDDERKVRGLVVVATRTAQGNYPAGSSDIFRYGDIRHALARGDVLELSDSQNRKVAVQIELQGLPSDLAARSGVRTSLGDKFGGEQCTLPLSEALELAQSRRVIGVGDSPLAKFLTACGRRPLSAPVRI
jgi:hypothetical protein